MKNVILVVEGGGSPRLDVALRQAIDVFLAGAKAKVRAARQHWDTLAGGGRDDAYDKFLDLSAKNPDSLVLLLVDSEGATNDSEWTKSIWSTRSQREPKLFFMVQCMEAWIVADSPSLVQSYRGKFKDGPLPKRPPEECSPEELRRALGAATKDCGLGSYEKRHGPILLAKVRPEEVVKRCPSAKTFIEGLDTLLR